MKDLVSARGTRSAALRVAVLAAMLMLAAGTSQAYPNDGRGSGGDGRGYRGGGDRHDNGGGRRMYKGGGGDRRDGGDWRRAYDGGGRRTYDWGGGGNYGGGSGRPYADRGGRIYGGGSCYGGVRYYDRGVRYYDGGGRCYGPTAYRYVRPRTFVSFGIGLGLPYYCPPAYHSYVQYHSYAQPYPVEVESGTSIDVTNEPPAGCYYYDRFCDRQFSNLDDYTDHLQSQDHAQTIEIVQRDSGDRLRTLEFVDGLWRAQR